MWALQRFDFLADSDSDDHGDGKGENLKMGADYDFEYDHFEVISLESVVPAVDDLLDLPPLPQQLQRHQARLVVPVLIMIIISSMIMNLTLHTICMRIERSRRIANSIYATTTTTTTIPIVNKE